MWKLIQFLFFFWGPHIHLYMSPFYTMSCLYVLFFSIQASILCLLVQVHACLATAAQTYSPDFLSLLQTLLFKPPDVEALCAAASNHTMDELTSAYAV